MKRKILLSVIVAIFFLFSSCEAELVYLNQDKLSYYYTYEIDESRYLLERISEGYDSYYSNTREVEGTTYFRVDWTDIVEMSNEDFSRFSQVFRESLVSGVSIMYQGDNGYNAKVYYICCYDPEESNSIPSEKLLASLPDKHMYLYSVGGDYPVKFPKFFKSDDKYSRFYIKGTILDAISGEGIDDARILFYRGDKYSDRFYYTASASSDGGDYRVPYVDLVPSGSYTCSVIKEGYTFPALNIGINNEIMNQVAVSNTLGIPELAVNELFVLVTWEPPGFVDVEVTGYDESNNVIPTNWDYVGAEKPQSDTNIGGIEMEYFHSPSYPVYAGAKITNCTSSQDYYVELNLIQSGLNSTLLKNIDCTIYLFYPDGTYKQKQIDSDATSATVQFINNGISRL